MRLLTHIKKDAKWKGRDPMAYKRWIAGLTGMLLAVLGACSPSPKPESKQQDYQETKQMIVDVLQSQEGKKAFQELLKEPEFRNEIIINDHEFEQAFQKLLTDPKMSKQLETVLAKTEVASNFAKVTQKEQAQLSKQLMKDPEYQKMMMDLWKDPEYTKQLLQLMKSQDYRKQTMKVMEEALDNPMFKEKFSKLMEEAMKKQQQGESGGQKQGGGGQEQQQGEQQS